MPEINALPGTPLPPQSESSRMKDIQKRHETLIRQSTSITTPSVLGFLDELTQAGADISDPEYRSQLRDFARYWANFVNNKTGAFPIFQLQPFDESKSPNIRITGTEELKSKSSFKASIIGYVRAYSASLVSTGIAVPILASIVIASLYLPSLFPPLYSVIFGILFTLAGWILFAAPYSYFTTARGANERSYSLLTSRLLELKAHLGVVEDTDGKSEVVAQKSVNQIALREVYANYISAKNLLQNSSRGLIWVSGTGYINCWELLHRAEEALIEIEPLEIVLRGAMHDKLSIQGSTIGNHVELLDKLIKAVRDLDPSSAVQFESQANSTLKTLIQDLNENKKILNQLMQLAKKDRNQEQTNTQEITKDITFNTEHSQAKARTALREVRRTLNDFRDHLWEGLIRARNQLLMLTAIIGFVTLVLLCITVLTSSLAVSRSAVMAATVFYIVGAMTGLFGQLYRESIGSIWVNDYGLSFTRLFATPLLSGLAGVGGVLIVVILTGLLEQHSITLEAVFTLNPQYLLVSAIFGLTPNLLIRRLQQRAEKYISDLQTSTSAQQKMEETTSQRHIERETTKSTELSDKQSMKRTEREEALSTLPISAVNIQEKRKDLGPVWNIPYQRNPFFTGREDLLEQLHDHFTQAKTIALAQPLAITGLGGIGKTQVAIEYAYRYRDDYSALLWVRARTQEELLADLVIIANLLNLSEKNVEDQRIPINAVKYWFETHTKWLLICDKADDLLMIRDELPIDNRGHILLTTRAQSMSGFAYKVEIETMEPEEGALFLLRRAGIIEPDAILDNASTTDCAIALELVQELDGLPLALDQAGAYIEETRSSLSGYLTLYRQQRTKLLQWRGDNVFEHSAPVATTWSLAFEKIELANPAASELLRFCTFLAPDAIPEEIFTEGADELGPILRSVAADPFALNLAIRELLNYSFVKRDPEAQQICIHRLVQAVLKDDMDEGTQRQWAERTVKAVNSAFPDVEFEVWPRCQRLLPHARVCAVLIEQWDFAFPAAARLLDQVGYYLKARASYTEALPLLQRALAIREKALGSDHADTATSLNMLFQSSLTIKERLLGPDHPDTATGLNSLADLYVDQGAYEHAEPLFQRAIAIREKILGPNHPDTASSLNSLADLYVDQGAYEHAEPLFQRTLVIREHLLGPEHPDTASSLNSLADLYADLDKYEQAEVLFRRALTIRERVLGPDHPKTRLLLENYTAFLRR